MTSPLDVLGHLTALFPSANVQQVMAGISAMTTTEMQMTMHLSADDIRHLARSPGSRYVTGRGLINPWWYN